MVVTTWNGRSLLERSLPALVEQEGVRHEIIVVDNGSSDGTAEWVTAAFPQARLTRLARNQGFAAGNNAGFRFARAPLVATINNDAVPSPDWLAQLVEAAQSKPRFGMFASRMVFAHDPNVTNSAGICTDALGIAWDRLVGADAADHVSAEVFGASGGAALYRRELLDELGGFDPLFFAYLEDVDLAWRAQWRGWRAWYVAQATVRHEHSRTGREDSPFKSYLLGRNKIWTVMKSYPAGPLLRYLPAMLVYDAGSLPVTVARQRSPAALRGRLAALAGLSAMIQARKQIMSSRKASWRELRARLEPVEPPWSIWRRHRRLRRVLAAR